MKNLVIVEAPGKVDTLQRALRGIGLFASVIATIGHVAENPRDLADIGLNADLVETKYLYREDREQILDNVQRAAYQADRIFIATDDDAEGDVIAFDISRLLSDQADRLHRVRLRAITPEELIDAFSAASHEDFALAARNGIARRTVDRAIGSTYTLPQGSATIAVGRVQGSLLATIAEGDVIAGTFAMAVKTGRGDVLTAETPIRTAEDLRTAQAAAAALLAGHGRVVSTSVVDEPSSSPWGYERILFEATSRLNIDIVQAAALLQDTYEKGRVTYPRVRHPEFTEEARRTGAALAARNRCDFDAGALAARGADVTGAHEAPRVSDDSMMLGRALGVLSQEEALAVLIGRNLIECGQTTKKRKATIEAGSLSLDFSLVMSEGRKNWKTQAPEMGYRPYTREQALLRLMAGKELGRPSTVVSHVRKALDRGLIHETGVAISLTDRGEAWLLRAHTAGIGPTTATRVEKALEGSIAEPHIQAKAVLSELGMLPKIVERINAREAHAVGSDLAVGSSFAENP